MKIEAHDIDTVKTVFSLEESGPPPSPIAALGWGIPIMVDTSVPRGQVMVRDDEDDVIAIISQSPWDEGVWFFAKIPKDPLSQGLFARRVRGEAGEE